MKRVVWGTELKTLGGPWEEGGPGQIPFPSPPFRPPPPFPPSNTSLPPGPPPPSTSPKLLPQGAVEQLVVHLISSYQHTSKVQLLTCLSRERPSRKVLCKQNVLT